MIICQKYTPQICFCFVLFCFFEVKHFSFTLVKTSTKLYIVKQSNNEIKKQLHKFKN